MLLTIVSIVSIVQSILLVKLIRNSDWFRGKLQRANLSSECREQIRKLESDRAEIASWIPVHERALLTVTDGENSFQYRHHRSKIAGLRGKIDKIDEQIALIQPEPPTYEPAFPADKVSSTCGHPQLHEVESGGEVVAYICESCKAQVMPDDRAARAHEARKHVDQEWDRVQL